MPPDGTNNGELDAKQTPGNDAGTNADENKGGAQDQDSKDTSGKGGPDTKPDAGKADQQPPVDGKSAEKTDDKATDKKESVVPEKYDLKLQQDSVLDTSVVDEIAAIARERGLSNEQAQAALDEVEGKTKATREANLQRWSAETKAAFKDEDPTAFDKTLKLARDRFIPKDSPLARLLDQSGYGSHPAVVKHFYELGKAMREDSATQSVNAGGKPPEKTSSQVMYPDMYDENGKPKR